MEAPVLKQSSFLRKRGLGPLHTSNLKGQGALQGAEAACSFLPLPGPWTAVSGPVPRPSAGIGLTDRQRGKCHTGSLLSVVLHLFSQLLNETVGFHSQLETDSVRMPHPSPSPRTGCKAPPQARSPLLP